MTHSFTLPNAPLKASAPARKRAIVAFFAALAVLALALVAGRLLTAQVEGDRGIPAIASSTDIDVSGIEVDVRGDNAQDARENGWREAHRKAWAKLGGPQMPDSQLQSLVSAVVIERERVGPRRYIATLGVIFDRARAGRYLGGKANARRSAPMLLLPVTISAGSQMIYEKRNPWQLAWAEYQTGSSPINYVRPSGSGGDSLLLTYGQTSRRSRIWWRNILDEFEAADVLVPIAKLEHQYPGGPIKGTFTARYGPDNTFLDSFTMTAKGDADLALMLRSAVTRFDEIYGKALAEGKLKPDSSLTYSSDADPVLQRLIEIGRAAQAKERADRAAASSDNAQTESTATATPTPTPTAAVTSSYVVQFASPDAGSIDATLAAVRSAAGVRGAATTSLAIGGTSVMSVTYSGSLSDLAAALRARGFTVNQGGNALAIRR